MNDSENKSFISYAIYILSLLTWGTNGFLVSHISLDSAQIVLTRTLIGGALLTCIVLLRGGFDKKSVRADRLPLLLGGFALGMNWVALFGAYRLLNVSLATLIYYVGPILVVLFSPVLFKEKLTGRKITAVILVAAGLVCISGSVMLSGLNSAGLLVAMLSALFYAMLIVMNKRIVHTGGLQTAALELDIAIVVALVYVLCTSGLPNISRGDLPYIAVLGFVNTGLAYVLYFTGLMNLPVQSVALISYLDPVSALLFSAALLNCRLSAPRLL